MADDAKADKALELVREWLPRLPYARADQERWLADRIRTLLEAHEPNPTARQAAILAAAEIRQELGYPLGTESEAIFARHFAGKCFDPEHAKLTAPIIEFADAMQADDWLDGQGRAATAEARVRELEAECMAFREFLWLSHGHVGLYGDDGEMQCSFKGSVDFKRGPIETLTSHCLAAAREIVAERDAAIKRAEEAERA